MLTSFACRPLKYPGANIFIRYNKGISILEKTTKLKQGKFSSIVSSRKPFGLATNFKEYNHKKNNNDDIKVYATREVGWLAKDENIKKLRNQNWIEKWKVFLPKAIGSGNMSEDVFKPILGEPNSISTETYVLIGPFNNEREAQNVISYIRTKFFHFMAGLGKVTQDATAKIYNFVPIQDFSKPWTDEELYKKYNLSNDEIEFIESMIRPMDLED